MEGLFVDFYGHFSGNRQTSHRRNTSVLYETPQTKDYLPKLLFFCPFKTNSGIYEGINQQIDRAFSRLATASFPGKLTCPR